MKKILFASLTILLVFLSACATQAPATQSVSALPTQAAVVSAPTTAPVTSNNSAGLNTSYDNAVPVEMQLLLGTIQLEGTAQAITKEQASALLPLWTNIQTLSQSAMPQQGNGGQPQANSTPQAADTQSQAQIDAFVQQIESVMTGDQIKAIADMKITQQTAMTMMQAQGLTKGNPQQGNGTAQGNVPQGTPSGNGQQMGTPPTDGQQSGMGFVPPQLTDTLIQLLKTKINA